MTAEKPPASGWTYMWDQQNRLKEVTKGSTTVKFTYRHDGLRASKTVNGLTIDYVYDGNTVVGEKRSDGKSVWYTPGPNGYISRTVVNDSTGQVLDKEWFVYDGLGSCRAMVKPNAQGTDAVITARMDYDVYGKVRTQTGSTDSKFKYVAGIGHPTDEETGLIYMRARYYDPQVGRFVSEDPARHGMNWLTYASGNPANRIDPDGATDIAELTVSIGISGLLSGFLNGLITWLNGGNFAAGFLTGLLTGLISAASLAFGPLGGIIGGAIAGALNAWLNGGSAKAVFVSAVVRAIGGGLLGKVLAANEGSQLEMLFEILLGADAGLIQTDIGIGVHYFG